MAIKKEITCPGCDVHIAIDKIPTGCGTDLTAVTVKSRRDGYKNGEFFVKGVDPQKVHDTVLRGLTGIGAERMEVYDEDCIPGLATRITERIINQ